MNTMISEEPRDALDVLRNWSSSFGSLKPKLTIENGIVVQVLVRRGDEEIQLRRDTVLRRNHHRKNTNSHF